MTKPSSDSLDGEYNPFTAPMVVGQGVTGGPTDFITYEDLVREATQVSEDEDRFEWPCVAKESAKWLLPSTLSSRTAAQQVKSGTFGALVVDVDSGAPQFKDVDHAVSTATGGAVALVYSTKSATFRNPRWRIIVPLERPLAGADYADTARAFYDLMREASDGRVDPDDAGARPGQISFLPNAPDGDPNKADYLAFAAEIGDDSDSALNLTESHPIVRLREMQRHEAQVEAKAAAEQAKRRRGGGVDVRTTLIARFNARHRIAELLSRYHYHQATDTTSGWLLDHWRSPYQTSGSFATRVYRDDNGGERWVSLSGSDAKRGLGAKSASGGSRYGDAFDLYVHFEHGGDAGAAREAWKANCDRDRHAEVEQLLARRRRAISEHHDRLRALGGAPTMRRKTT